MCVKCPLNGELSKERRVRPAVQKSHPAVTLGIKRKAGRAILSAFLFDLPPMVTTYIKEVFYVYFESI